MNPEDALQALSYFVEGRLGADGVSVPGTETYVVPLRDAGVGVLNASSSLSLSGLSKRVAYKTVETADSDFVACSHRSL